jgi:transcriptional regulator with XRE-family HTH domain
VSSIIFTKDVRALPAENITLDGMPRKRGEGLADLIRKAQRDDPALTLRKIEERSGGEITHSYLSKILSGSAKHLTSEKLKAVAKGLRLPESVVLTAAAGGSPEDTPAYRESRLATLFYEIEELSAGQRDDLYDLIEAETQRRKLKTNK